MCFSFATVFKSLEWHPYRRGYILWGLGEVVCSLKKNSSGDLLVCFVDILLLVTLESHLQGFFFAVQREGNYFSQREY